MSKQAYIAEVTALHAPERLRRRVAALPEREKDGPPRAAGTTFRNGHHRISRWGAIAAALVLVAGLGIATPYIWQAIAPPGGEIDPPPVVTESPMPEGIIAEGIDVSPMVLDAAKEYVEAQYRTLTQSARVDGPVFCAVFDNWRIEAVESVYDGKELGEYTVGVWRLKYRIHTTTPEQINPMGSMELDGEGWLSPNAPESTYLVFLLNYSTPHSFPVVIREYSPGSAGFDASIRNEILAYLGPQTETPSADPWGITLRAEDVTNKGLTLVCEQSGGAPTGVLQTGSGYTLERLSDMSTWEGVETMTGEPPVWQQTADSIPTDGSVRWEVNLRAHYHTLTHGTYRIGIEIMDYRDPGDEETKNYYADFTVSGLDSFSDLNFAAYQDVMTAEEWADMEAFLPVLLEGKPFRWTETPLREAGDAVPKVRGDITLDEFLPQIWGEARESNELHLWQLAVADADGDGKRELVLALKDAGYYYLVLHREGDKFYGIDFPVRWFQGLQTNGVYGGSGGAAYQSYYKMTFENGTFVEENLGNEAWWSGENGTFDIGGEAVDADTFVAWRDALLVGDVTWYGPISKGVVSETETAAAELYRNILLGKTTFLYAGDSTWFEPMNIADARLIFDPTSRYAKISSFVVVDLNGDDEREVVLRISDVANDMSGYLVLHREDGKVYCFRRNYRTFDALKTDSTFAYSTESGSEYGIASLGFMGKSCVTNHLIRATGAHYDFNTFTVDDQPVSQEEFDAALNEQAEKVNVQWHDFTEANIEAILKA